MAYTKTILCLANSRMKNNRCVAGKEFVNGRADAWIRPVSTQEFGGVSFSEQKYADRRRPVLGDIVEIKFDAPRPGAYQRENHLISQNCAWRKAGSASWNDITAALDRVNGTLWSVGDSSQNGLNDRVPVNSANRFNYSLRFIRPENFRISVKIEGAEFYNPRRKMRGSFIYEGTRYKLAITDTVIENRYRQAELGNYPVPGALLCVSLGEPYRGFAYKLIAGVITPDQAVNL